MKSVSWQTAFILVATIASVTFLTWKGLQIPSAIAAILGAIGAAFAPNLYANGNGNGNGKTTSVRPPSPTLPEGRCQDAQKKP